MKVCVVGLWHLGTVTAAGLAAGGHDVTGLDVDPAVVARLARGTPPLFEPGLGDLVRDGLASGHLRFTADAVDAVHDAEVVWITCDTPVNEDDCGDVTAVIDTAVRVFPYLRDGALVLVSSQVPVGTTRQLERLFGDDSRGRAVAFGYSPENLRLGQAIQAFMKPDRVVVGVRSAAARDVVMALLRPFTSRIEWMSVESAEMTKHALNAFLATSVAFVNEIAVLCEQVGADATEVERGLKTESRIGPNAYLTPGAAFAGGTLARDVMFLARLSAEHGLVSHLLSSVMASNDAHAQWAQRWLTQLLGDISGATVGIWGLTYKPGTGTLRRSPSVKLCEWLVDRGATVRAHDPVLTSLPSERSSRVVLVESAPAAADGASALVVATPWPEYREVPACDVTGRMARRLVLDAARFTRETLGADASIEYVSVGKATA